MSFFSTYGEPHTRVINETDDIVGIRTLVLERAWQPSVAQPTPAQLDAERPAPPSVPGGLALIGQQTRQQSGYLTTTWTFQGVAGDGKTVTFKDRLHTSDYGFEAGFAQVSIILHPRFESLVKTYGGFPDNETGRVLWPARIATNTGDGVFSGTDVGNASFDGASSASSGKLNPMYGVSEYFRMEGTYHCRYVEKELPPSLLSGVGKIATSLPGKPPALQDRRNWLMAPPVYRFRGTVYDITENYWLSGPGGWPSPVYR